MKKSIFIVLATFFGVIACKEKTTNKQATTQEITASEVLNKEDSEKLKKVQDALQDFPSANAEIVNGALVVSGNVSPTQERKIKEAIETLNIGEYTNNLVVK